MKRTARRPEEETDVRRRAARLDAVDASAVDGVEGTRVREPTDPDLPAKRAKTTTRDLVARDHKLVRVGANQSLDAFFPGRHGAPARGVAETPSNAVNAVNVANTEPTRVENAEYLAMTHKNAITARRTKTGGLAAAADGRGPEPTSRTRRGVPRRRHHGGQQTSP